MPEPQWYLVYTKPRQEALAQEHLQRQGYPCYLPLYSAQKVKAQQFQVVREPLFPRYLFIQLGHNPQDKGWGPIRSTTGVSTLVRFGVNAARVPHELIEQLRQHEATQHSQPPQAFTPGQVVQVTAGPFAGLQAVFHMAQGEQRALVLMEILGKQAKVGLRPDQLKATQE